MGRVKKHGKNPPEYIRRIGALISEKADYSEEKLGTDLGTNRSMVSNWLSDTSIPNADMIIKMAEVFDISTEWILGLVPFDGDRRRKPCATDDLGLTQLAVDRIRYWNQSDSLVRRDALNRLLEQKQLSLFLLAISDVLNTRDKIKEYETQESSNDDSEGVPGYAEACDLINSCGQAVLDLRDVLDLNKWVASQYFAQILEEI